MVKPSVLKSIALTYQINIPKQYWKIWSHQFFKKARKYFLIFTLLFLDLMFSNTPRTIKKDQIDYWIFLCGGYIESSYEVHTYHIPSKWVLEKIKVRSMCMIENWDRRGMKRRIELEEQINNFPLLIFIIQKCLFIFILCSNIIFSYNSLIFYHLRYDLRVENIYLYPPKKHILTKWK